MDLLALGLFGAGAAWIAYVFFGYPAALWLVGRISPFHDTTRYDCTPTVSVLVAARNEVNDIEWKIRETLDWNYPPERLDIVVASDASDDGTDEIVTAIGEPRVRLVRMDRRGGKVRALNQLIETAQADLLLFTDANTHIGPDALRRMTRHFANPQVGCVTGRTQSLGAADPVGAGASLYWDYEAFVAALESRFGGVLVCDGAIHCARRKAVRELRPDLANDLELPVIVRTQGYRTMFEPMAVAEEAETESALEEYARRRRICGQGALALWTLRRSLSPLMAWQFISRKLLRWLILIPLFLVLCGSALLAREPLFAAILVAQLVFYGIAGAAHFFPALIGAFGSWFAGPYYALLGAVGAFQGVVETIRGRRFDVWEIAALSRGH